MQQRLVMQLRKALPSGQNLQDGFPQTDGQWSQGATLIDLVALTPPLTERWQILAWELSYDGSWFIPAGGNGRPYGKLGALWAGLVSSGASPTGLNTPGTIPYRQPMLSLPSDLSTLQKVWDGGTDPLFPNSSTPPAAPSGTRGASQNLPVPIDVDPGKPLGFGLWLTPSLTNRAYLFIWNAVVAIVYEDGAEDDHQFNGRRGLARVMN